MSFYVHKVLFPYLHWFAIISLSDFPIINLLYSAFFLSASCSSTAATG